MNKKLLIKWAFQKSDDGTNNNYTNGAEFETLQDFADSKHNTHLNDNDKISVPESEENGVIVQRYTIAYRITTSKETDEKDERSR